jgi:hypothetical protein
VSLALPRDSVFNVAQVEGYAASADAVPVLPKERLHCSSGWLLLPPARLARAERRHACLLRAGDGPSADAPLRGLLRCRRLLRHVGARGDALDRAFVAPNARPFRPVSHGRLRGGGACGGTWRGLPLGDLATEPRDDHAQYVAGWLELLRGDPRAMFTAASKAQQAADWLYDAAMANSAAA